MRAVDLLMYKVVCYLHRKIDRSAHIPVASYFSVPVLCLYVGVTWFAVRTTCCSNVAAPFFIVSAIPR